MMGLEECEDIDVFSCYCPACRSILAVPTYAGNVGAMGICGTCLAVLELKDGKVKEREMDELSGDDQEIVSEAIVYILEIRRKETGGLPN